MSTEDTKLKVVRRTTDELQAKHDVTLRQMRNATRKVSRLDLDILGVYERIETRAEAATGGCAAVLE